MLKINVWTVMRISHHTSFFNLGSWSFISNNWHVQWTLVLDIVSCLRVVSDIRKIAMFFSIREKPVKGMQVSRQILKVEVHPDIWVLNSSKLWIMWIGLVVLQWGCWRSSSWAVQTDKLHIYFTHTFSIYYISIYSEIIRVRYN